MCCPPGAVRTAHVANPADVEEDGSESGPMAEGKSTVQQPQRTPVTAAVTVAQPMMLPDAAARMPPYFHEAIIETLAYRLDPNSPQQHPPWFKPLPAGAHNFHPMRHTPCCTSMVLGPFQRCPMLPMDRPDVGVPEVRF